MPTPPLRVLLVAPQPPPAGGIALWTRMIVTTATPRADIAITTVNTAVRWRPSTHHSWLARVLGGSIQACRDYGRVTRRLRDPKPDAMHVCTSGSIAFARDAWLLAAARRRQVPGILHIRFGRVPDVIARHGWEWRLLRAAARQATVLLVLDRPSEAALRAACPQLRIERIPNPIGLNPIPQPDATPPPQRPTPPRITYVGQLLPSKGLRELVQACARIHDPPCLLELVGAANRPFQQELQQLAQARDAGSWLSFTGEIPQSAVAQHLLAATVFALPSHTEGFPNVILEAMALSRPIVATAVGAIPDILNASGDRPCGICVPPGNVSALQDALLALLLDPARARTMGNNACTRVHQEYSMTAIFPRYLELWHSVAGTPAD